MCGRFTLVSNLDLLLYRFKIAYLGDTSAFLPRYNIAPSQNVWAIVSDGTRNRLGQLRWGLVPTWAKDASIGHKMINARAETLSEKPSFRYAFKQRRCLILADSFYEWKKTAWGKKPIRIRLKTGKPFALAGLWERWLSPEGEVMTSCTIITTEANEIMRDIHHRMPVILHEEDEATWLDRTIKDTAFLRQLLVPFPSEMMETYEVSSTVNSPKNDSPECIESVNQQDVNGRQLF